LNRNIIYGGQCDILSKDGVSHMNARATLSNGMTVEQNGGGTVVTGGTQENFDVVQEILKCGRSTVTVAACICNGTSNLINNSTHS
jgi:hypothetical protein